MKHLKQILFFLFLFSFMCSDAFWKREATKSVIPKLENKPTLELSSACDILDEQNYIGIAWRDKNLKIKPSDIVKMVGCRFTDQLTLTVSSKAVLSLIGCDFEKGSIILEPQSVVYLQDGSKAKIDQSANALLICDESNIVYRKCLDLQNGNRWARVQGINAGNQTCAKSWHYPTCELYEKHKKEE